MKYGNINEPLIRGSFFVGIGKDKSIGEANFHKCASHSMASVPRAVRGANRLQWKVRVSALPFPSMACAPCAWQRAPRARRALIEAEKYELFVEFQFLLRGQLYFVSVSFSFDLDYGRGIEVVLYVAENLVGDYGVGDGRCFRRYFFPRPVVGEFYFRSVCENYVVSVGDGSEEACVLFDYRHFLVFEIRLGELLDGLGQRREIYNPV